MQTKSETLTVDGSDMRCHIAIPDVTPAPGIVVAQHAGGVDAFIRSMTDRLAEAGFTDVTGTDLFPGGVASLVVALTVTPVLSSYFLPGLRTVKEAAEPAVARWLSVWTARWTLALSSA